MSSPTWNIPDGVEVIRADTIINTEPFKGPCYLQIEGESILTRISDHPHEPLHINLDVPGTRTFPKYTTVITTGRVVDRTIPLVDINKRFANIIAQSAMWSSAGVGNIPPCLPNTRVEVLSVMMDWATNPNAKKFLWFSGPPLSGKSTISMTVARALDTKNLLAAGFFFSSHIQAKDLIPTLVYQIIQHRSLDALRQCTLSALRKELLAPTETMKRQLEKLLLEPLRQIPEEDRDENWNKLVIVIDGLDECQEKSGGYFNPRVHREILETLVEATEDLAFPFRILVTGRPQMSTVRFFSTTGKDAALQVFLDRKYCPDADIDLYLKSKFADIRREYSDLPLDWPGEETVLHLVKRSAGLIGYAALAAMFIEYGTRSPVYQLNCLLGIRGATTKEEPFAFLDALYSRILSGPDGDSVFPSMWVSLISLDLLKGLPAYFLDRFLEPEPLDSVPCHGVLAPLLQIPQPGDTTTSYSMPLHSQALQEYFDNPSRCDPRFYSTLAERKEFLLDRYISVLKDKGPRRGMWATSLVRDEFLKHFIPLVGRFELWISEMSPDKAYFKPEDYLACDVDWFMGILLEQLKDGSETAVVQAMFDNVHRGCKRHCDSACAHWRRSIVKACQDCNRAIPGELLTLCGIRIDN
ncbi:hypothetical protein DFP72DRAFT_187673 [Ephemerocybe angulata]|uniref:NACHT domain-containing protein n=1 Tax=Ephemerocybe angulata TaxID=980116 RepID=A0A8H6I658_9AGAR|nr:hypothetical protein DFP72DRAFT_187673 [Tulosesus angulatus]